MEETNTEQDFESKNRRFFSVRLEIKTVWKCTDDVAMEKRTLRKKKSPGKRGFAAFYT